MVPIRVAGPAVEPVTLAEMRVVLRLDDEAEDDLVSALIPMARARIEALARRTLIATTFRLILPGWPAGDRLALPVSPLLSVAQVGRLEPDGTITLLDPALARPDPLAVDPPALCLATSRPAPAPGALAIDVVAGYGAAAADVPAPLREAVRRGVARAFEHRGDAAPPDAAMLDAEIAALVAPCRALHL